MRSARRLGNAVLLTQDGYGHVSFHDPSACIDRAQGRLPGQPGRAAEGQRLQVDKRPFAPGFGQAP